MIDFELSDQQRAVRDLASAAMRRIRGQGPPIFVEAATYRFVPHSRADPIPVQPDDEMAEWRDRDPVAQERRRLVAEGADEAALDDLEARIQREIEEAVRQATDDPFPDPGEAWEER